MENSLLYLATTVMCLPWAHLGGLDILCDMHVHLHGPFQKGYEFSGDGGHVVHLLVFEHWRISGLLHSFVGEVLSKELIRHISHGTEHWQVGTAADF